MRFPRIFYFLFFRISTLLSRIFICFRKCGSLGFLFLLSQNLNTSFSDIYLFQKTRILIFIFYFSEFQHFFLEYLFILENQDFHFCFCFFRFSTLISQIFIYFRKPGFSFLFFICSQFQHFFLEYLFIFKNQDFHFIFYLFTISTPLCQLFIYFRK